jgi:hypothetical protein
VDKQNLLRVKEDLEARQAALLSELNREMETKLEIKFSRLTKKQKEELADGITAAHEKEYATKLKEILPEEE